MNPETLETLLMDDALGAASPEVHALLEAYAAGNPAIQSQMTQWRELTTRTQAAIGPSTSLSPPVFPRQHLINSQRARLFRNAIATSGLIAACLLLGFTLGTLRSQVVQQPSPVASAVSLARIPASTPTPAVAQVHDIWSLNRLHQAALRQEAQFSSATHENAIIQKALGGHL